MTNFNKNNNLYSSKTESIVLCSNISKHSFHFHRKYNIKSISNSVKANQEYVKGIKVYSQH